MTQIRVTVSRWQSRGPWWQGRRRLPGLELDIDIDIDIDGHGTTQTYGTRDLDDARAMVLEYLDTVGAAVPADAVIEWVETGT
ncbi:hypothetical protein [Prescottella subtropica]|uniref:hypothetical protein n=1 Tax=Prescottella subtropica TaxID=2545757 RepID=UPI0010F8672A|nr:hypothetical protein [Prescottella subtropica]